MHDATPTLFIVDDDDAVRRALARLIGAAGYRTQSYASVEAFLDADTSALSGPACLVLDVFLPGLGGFNLQRALASQQQHAMLPIIFVTNHGDIPMTVSAMKAGATDFIAKPVDDAALLKAIDAALARASSELRERIEMDSIQQRLQRLTPREREVLVLVVSGLLNKQVASDWERWRRPSRCIAPA